MIVNKADEEGNDALTRGRRSPPPERRANGEGSDRHRSRSPMGRIPAAGSRASPMGEDRMNREAEGKDNKRRRKKGENWRREIGKEQKRRNKKGNKTNNT